MDIKVTGTLYKLLHDNWEEVPDEDLWEDGELDNADVLKKIYRKVIIKGNWKLIRRKQ